MRSEDYRQIFKFSIQGTTKLIRDKIFHVEKEDLEVKVGSTT